VTRIEQAYQSAKSLRAEFEQKTFVAVLDREQTRHGTLQFAKDRFRVDYTTPQKQSYIFNGETLWIYSPEYKEVELFEQAQRRISREALSFLSGLGHLRKQFRITKIERYNNAIHLHLVPKATDALFRKLELSFAHDSLKIEEAILWPQQGNRSHYYFSGLITDQEPDKKQFSFTPPKGTKVVRPDA